MHFFVFFLLLGLSAASFASAQNQFVPLVGIPYVDTRDANVSLGDYVNSLYFAAISVAAFLAVVKIIFSGVQYMLSDVVTDKSQARKSIRGALLGLLIVIGAVLILNTINPQLSNLNVLELDEITIPRNPTVNTGPVVNDITCESQADEMQDFINSCLSPKVINSSIDASSACTTYSCDDTAIATPELSCSGDSCTCDFSGSVGPSQCVTQCKIKSNSDGTVLQSHSINHSNTTVTCSFSSAVVPVSCTRVLASCPTLLGICPTITDPSEICNSTTVNANTIYYGLE